MSVCFIQSRRIEPAERDGNKAALYHFSQFRAAWQGARFAASMAGSRLLGRHRQGFGENCGRHIKSDYHRKLDDLARREVTPQLRCSAFVDGQVLRRLLGEAERGLLLGRKGCAVWPIPEFVHLQAGNAAIARQRHVARPDIGGIEYLCGPQDRKFSDGARQLGVAAEKPAPCRPRLSSAPARAPSSGAD
jgi:hypothetical protein